MGNNYVFTMNPTRAWKWGTHFNACATQYSYSGNSRLIEFVPLGLRAVRGRHGMEPRKCAHAKGPTQKCQAHTHGR